LAGNLSDDSSAAPSPAVVPEGPGPAPAAAAPTVGAPAPVPPPPRRHARWLWVAVGVAVALVVAFSTLYVAGVYPFERSSPLGSELTFSEARAAATRSADGYGGGSWALVLAGGVDLAASTSVPLGQNLSGSGLNCSVQYLSGASELTVPAFHGSVSSGTSPFWLFVFRDASGNALVISVANGVATRLASAGAGTTCTEALGILGAVPDSIVDSPQAVSLADQAGGGAFLQAHPNATVALALIGGVSLFGQARVQWIVVYTTCNGNGSAGSTFNATVNAVTGDLVGSGTSNATCPTAAGVPIALGSAASFVSSAPGYPRAITDLSGALKVSTGSGAVPLGRHPFPVPS
jgi:hypothetical protein